MIKSSIGSEYIKNKWKLESLTYIDEYDIELFTIQAHIISPHLKNKYTRQNISKTPSNKIPDSNK